MKIKDVMVREIVTIEGSATLFEAAQRMSDANVGVLPVVEDGEVAGVITDRDLVIRGMARNANPMTTTVGECASKQPICASPEWELEQALAVMSQEQIGRLPVIDDDAHVIGIVTLSSVALRAGNKGETLQAAQEVAKRSAKA